MRAQQPLAHIIEGFNNIKEERKTLLAELSLRFYLSGEGLEINATNYGKACVVLCERLRWYWVSNCSEKRAVRNKLRNYKGWRKKMKTVLEVETCEDKVNVAKVNAGLDFAKEGKANSCIP